MAFGNLLAFGSLTLISLCSCSQLLGKANLGKVSEVTYSVDHHATVISASYGKTYLLEGNVLARYADFDVARTLSRSVEDGHLELNAGCHDTIEIRDRTGRVHSTLELTPENKGTLMRFRVNNQNYFISSDSLPGSIRISLPSHHVAEHHVAPY